MVGGSCTQTQKATDLTHGLMIPPWIYILSMIISTQRHSTESPILKLLEEAENNNLLAPQHAAILDAFIQRNIWIHSMMSELISYGIILIS